MDLYKAITTVVPVTQIAVDRQFHARLENKVQCDLAYA